jgi:hypothetical protein
MQQLEHEVMARGDRVVSVRGMWTPPLGKFRDWNHRERIDGYRAVDG